jgi:hypothetical protein
MVVYRSGTGDDSCLPGIIMAQSWSSDVVDLAVISASGVWVLQFGATLISHMGARPSSENICWLVEAVPTKEPG